MYDAVTDSKVLTLVDGGQVCIPPSYNIEAALCQPPQQTPSVLLKLADASCVTLKRQTEDEAPYFLWGNKGPNVLPNTRPLPDGGYYLYTKVDGVTKRIRFTQCCNANGCAAEPFAKQCSLTI